VQAAAVSAMTFTILDQHAHAVPSGVLVNILGDIFIPTALVICENMVRGSRHHPTMSPVASYEEMLRYDKAEREKSRCVIDGASSLSDKDLTLVSTLEYANFGHSAVRTSSEEYDATISCISAVSVVFTTHLRRICRYPSFDKLWLRLLNLLCSVIHSCRQARLPGHAIEHGQLTRTEETCRKLLLEVIGDMRRHDIFELRPGLQIVSKETLLNDWDIDGEIAVKLLVGQQ
jgi:hypothetical protein